MSTALQVFNFKGQPVRVCVEDGREWFVANDVCERLGLTGTGPQVCRRISNQHKGVRRMHSPGGIQEMLCVDEAGLYQLIMKSIRKEALEFQEWVTAEVLPSIRRTGSYAVGQQKPITQLQVFEQMLKVMVEQQDEIRNVRSDVTLMKEDVSKVARDVKRIRAKDECLALGGWLKMDGYHDVPQKTRIKMGKLISGYYEEAGEQRPWLPHAEWGKVFLCDKPRYRRAVEAMGLLRDGEGKW